MKPAPLSDVETEQVRDLRARLNRIAAGPLGEKSVGPLSKGFFDVCARVGLAGAASGPTSVSDIIAAVPEADLVGLDRLVGSLRTLRESGAAWRPVMNTGVMQAILTRRLVLAGREQPKETGVRS